MYREIVGRTLLSRRALCAEIIIILHPPPLKHITIFLILYLKNSLNSGRSSATAGKNEKVGYEEEAAPAVVEEHGEEQQVDGGDSDERRSVEEIQREVKDRAKDAKVCPTQLPSPRL